MPTASLPSPTKQPERTPSWQPCNIAAVLVAANVLWIATLTPETAQLAGQGKCGATETKAPSEVWNNDAERKALLQSVICLINAERTSRNLIPLRIDGALVAAASGHSSEAVRLKWWTGSAS